MIKVTNISKKYKNEMILKNITLEFPNSGLVVIYGPSGCGKTTLLNCMSGLLDFQGSIVVDSHSLESMSDDALSDFRLREIGFIFQDFKLYESETVERNVLFPLESISNLSRKRKVRKCSDLLEIVGLPNINKKCVNQLSGGQKQRIAIARAMINDPHIIFADEPTGSLDMESGEEIMRILESISSQTLVVVVSHDRELSEKYADRIIEMKDGEIVSSKFTMHHHHTNYLPVLKNEISNKKQSIPGEFLFSHTWHSIKKRKWRTLFCNAITSLGLIGVGLATTLSSIISTNIKNVYSSLIGDNNIMVSVKDNEKSIYGQYAGSYYEAEEIKKEYSEYINDVGITYYTDFENYFPDKNSLCMSSTSYYTQIDGISVRNINEFEWLENNKNTIYPRPIKTLNDDEVVFGLTINMINDICFALRIVRTISSLSEYLEKNEVYFYFDLENASWEYSDQQIVLMKGFTLENQGCIYHSNHLWNQYMFEERMRFPTTDDVNGKTKYPWVLKKIPYFYCYNNIDTFLKKISHSHYGDYSIFEIANGMYYPWLLRDSDVKDIRRVLFFSNTLNHIPVRYSDAFFDVDDSINGMIKGSSSGYSIFSSSFMMGFSDYSYFSFDRVLLEETLESFITIDLASGQESKLDDGILCGHYSKTLQDGVSFKTINSEPINGKTPSNLDEIVISSSLKKSLNKTGIDSDVLYFAYPIRQETLLSGKIVKTYKITEIKVVGIINSEKNVIYHDSDWTSLFFQSRVGLSAFDLATTDIALSLKENADEDEIINNLQRAFPKYNFSNPLSDVNESVDEICSYISIALAIFSFVATIISAILLTICNYLHILENKKEIGLARSIGIKKKESRKFLLSHSIIMTSLSFTLSAIELFILSYVLSYLISDTLGGSFTYSFNPKSLIFMFALAITISLISTIFISSKITKMSPLEAVKN